MEVTPGTVKSKGGIWRRWRNKEQDSLSEKLRG
jgi:hypothetical protein